MSAYRDTPYWVHDIPFDARYAHYGSKPVPGGSWRNFPGQPLRFYKHRGPYMAARPFKPKASYHKDPEMNKKIRAKHRKAWNKREHARSSVVGNYGYQKRSKEAGFLDNVVGNIENNFPKEFVPFLEKELKNRKVRLENLTEDEIHEYAEAAVNEDVDMPEQAPRDHTIQGEGPQRKRLRDS